MPTYEYGCESCGHQWEQVQRITEAPVEVCPACAKSTAHRLISATNFILKGGGWYSDLYSSPAPKQPADASKKTDGADSAKKAEPKSDSAGEKTDKSVAKPTSSQSTTSTPSNPGAT